jgi:hypothetical protein
MDAHQFPDVTAVADAGMMSEANRARDDGCHRRRRRDGAGVGNSSPAGQETARSPDPRYPGNRSRRPLASDAPALPPPAPKLVKGITWPPPTVGVCSGA